MLGTTKRQKLNNKKLKELNLSSNNFEPIKIEAAAIVLGFLPAITSFLQINSAIFVATFFKFVGCSILLQYEFTNPETF